MYKKTLFPFLTILLLFSLGFSINLEVDFQGTYDNYDEETFTDRIGIKLYNYTPNFDITSGLAFYNDDKYYFYESNYYWDHYFLIENSYITLRNDDQTLELSGGIKQLKDEVNSPYSLFFSSNNIPLVNLDVGYEDEHFFFETMWVQLVSENNWNFAPKAMNYKTYGLKFGNFRVGYQDVLVYNRAFDFFYFLNPMPAYFAQEIRAFKNDMPWSEDINDNSIMGFFFDYKDSNYYIYSQLLVDDFNTNRFFNPEGTQNPDKVAFSSGLNLTSNLGTFGVYGAFATRYTFQPGCGDSSYTIYPESIYYYYNDDNEKIMKIIEYTDNYIGYKYGENTVSFLVDYDYTYNNWLNLYSSFETVFSGSKSPTEDTAPDEGTYLLDDPLLEKRYVYTIATNFYFKNLEFNLSADMGVIQNKLEFNEDKDTFEPSTEDENILRLNFGFGIEF
ncbi:hypothetical protein X928_03410 [Petrotoga miotherma DSM 10691]|uniref:Uncharacterized protein n=1 Tax=Petrotoga miotherma DSM 10691 TaxID=1434326 RepID=A0A2K1PE55_9BACT|nr:hypothetical protein [Petrotoga miotherma]PNS01083.1 hypothetical protein X928_03410 [Petrotoga miotherma DSM 10691]